MNKNQIGGDTRRTSEPVIAKSVSTKDAWRKSGGDALKVAELTPGGLRRVPQGTGGAVRPSDRYAGVSRGHSRRGFAAEGPNVWSGK